MEKRCSVCNLSKLVDAFGPKLKVPNGRASCRDCDAIYQRNYRKNNLDKCRRQNREHMARQRATAEGAASQRAAAHKCWQNGGAARQQDYLDRLRKNDFFRWKARKSYITLTEAQLRGLWERQKGLCALTGRALDHHAEIDHILPKTRGGDDTMENSRWVCHAANQAKHNLTDPEFFTICRDVMTAQTYTEWIGREMLARL